MRTVVLVLSLMLAGCAETLPQAADRAFADALRDVAGRYEAGQVTDAKLHEAIANAVTDARAAVMDDFAEDVRQASKPRRIELLRQLADEAEPQSPWSLAGVVVAALAGGAVLGMECERRMRRV